MRTHRDVTSDCRSLPFPRGFSVKANVLVAAGEQFSTDQGRLPTVWHNDEHLAPESRFDDPTDFGSGRSALPQDQLPVTEPRSRKDQVVQDGHLVVACDDIIFVPDSWCFVYVQGNHPLCIDCVERVCT